MTAINEFKCRLIASYWALAAIWFNSAILLDLTLRNGEGQVKVLRHIKDLPNGTTVSAIILRIGYRREAIERLRDQCNNVLGYL